MKLTKRVLSMVLCGLVVLGGNQATLVKADAQTRSANIAGSDKVPSAWKQHVRLGMQSKVSSSIKDGWSMEFVYKNGRLTLEGRTNVGSTWTFGDTFRLGWQKKNGEYGYTVFRPGSGSAADALTRAKNAFNNANIQAGDSIFFYGEKWETSLTLPDSSLMVKGITGNNYAKGYQPRCIDKKTAGFNVRNNGLYEAIINHR